MSGAYEAIVYDLDGTLVVLDVDWNQVARDAARQLRVRGIDVADEDLWEVLDRAEANGYRPAVEETLEDHEREGARTSRQLPLAEDLPGDELVGVCSLNCEAAVRIALELHGLDGYVGSIAGRDTVETSKPDPEPLLHVVDELGARPERTLFVGDTERDERTADRAGTDFQYVSDRV